MNERGGCLSSQSFQSFAIWDGAFLSSPFLESENVTDSQPLRFLINSFLFILSLISSLDIGAFINFWDFHFRGWYFEESNPRIILHRFLDLRASETAVWLRKAIWRSLRLFDGRRGKMSHLSLKRAWSVGRRLLILKPYLVPRYPGITCHTQNALLLCSDINKNVNSEFLKKNTLFIMWIWSPSDDVLEGFWGPLELKNRLGGSMEALLLSDVDFRDSTLVIFKGFGSVFGEILNKIWVFFVDFKFASNFYMLLNYFWWILVFFGQAKMDIPL